MKKAAVHAVTKLNLGDDLFLKILFDRYPNTEFVVLVSDKYKNKYKNYNNVSILSSSNYFYKGINYLMRKLGRNVFVHRKFFQKFDASISIGGSMYQQKPNWKSLLGNRKAFLIEEQPFYVLGANFGAYKDKEYYEEYLRLFKKYEDICFRDDYSYNLFKELANVRKAADIVFSLESKSPRLTDNKIVISVIKPSFRTYLANQDFEYYEKIKEITINYVKDGYDVVLMSFCKAEEDEIAIKEIKNIIPKQYMSKVYSHKYYGDIDKALNEIASSTAIVATRFHSMILGWLYNKPTFPIAYNEKMFNVMNDIGYEGKYINFDNLDTLLYKDYQINRNMETIDISSQIKDSEKHFQELDKLLK